MALTLTATAAEQLSHSFLGPTAGGSNNAPSLSADGRRVAFQSNARLIRKDQNNRSDVYVYDRDTKVTSLVSDDRGGDQPIISANGRFVAYRSLEGGVNRIRVRDLERGGVPLTASYPIDTSSYNRTAELAAISPDGRYVAYVFRASPNIDPTYPATIGSQIIVADTVLRTANKIDFRPPQLINTVAQLGRVCLSADGNSVVFDTTDAVTVDDTNTTADVYRATMSPATIKRLSRPSGVPDLGGATQPVLALDGATAFFLCDNPLIASDTDEQTSIYSSSSANGFGTPSLISTAAVPNRLAAQATVSGRFLAFLAQPAQAFVRNLTAGTDSRIASSANAPLKAPVLSGDDRFAAFSTAASNLSFGDLNGTPDVFAAAVPGAPSERTAPTATVSLSNGTALVVENTSITIGATATAGTGTLKLLTVEVDGVQQFRTTSAALAPQNYVAKRGVHDVRARAFDDAWIEGTSALSTLIVVPPDQKVGVTGATALNRNDHADGSCVFSGTLRVDNRRTSSTQALQVVFTVTSTPQIMAQFQGNLALVPNRGEMIFNVVDLPSLAALNFTTVDFSGITPPTEVFGDGYQGNGWSVIARLREKSGGNFIELESSTIFVTRPRLDENTDLPNTGIPVVGPTNGSGFNPGLLQSLAIVGPSKVAENARASFTASALFSNGSQSCNPAWSVTGANADRATIDDTGKLTAHSVDAPTTVTVRADFSGKSATMPVTIKPTTPIVSVTARDATASEAGDPGQFRILRAGGNQSELNVNYSLSGKAENGTDYSTLGGTANIPAGSSGVSIDVTPMQDAVFEGSESLVLSLTPGPGYRLGRSRSATVVITDDDPVPAGQPDLTFRRGNGPTVGLNVIDTDDEEITQILTAKARKGKAVSFTISLINPNNSPQDYTLLGGSGATGFIVQYLDGATDVTAPVIAGTFTVTQLAPGAAKELTLKITPTPDTPLGGEQLCVIRAQSNSGKVDFLKAFVTRVK